MKVLVIRQPWAWLIVNGHKDIENRTWDTQYRGPMLIQASASLPSKRKLEEYRRYARLQGAELPDGFETGGIVGMVQLENCVRTSKSRWFDGPVGWVLSHPKRLRFIALKGQLGLVAPPKAILRKLAGPNGGKVKWNAQ